MTTSVAKTLAMSEADAQKHLFALFDVADRLHTEWSASNTRAFRVHPGSSLARDNQLSDPYQVSFGASAALLTAVEHMHAVRALIQEAKILHPAAPFTVTRVAIETGSLAMWMISGPTRKERIHRRLQQMWQDIHDSDRFATDAKISPGAPLDVRKAKLMTVARTVLGDPNLTKLKQPETTEVVRVASRASKSRIDILSAWRLCAAFSHGRPWPSLGALDKQLTPDPDDPDVMHALLTSSHLKVLWPMRAAMRVTLAAFDLYEKRANRV